MHMGHKHGVCGVVCVTQLYEVALRNHNDVKFVTFDADHGYGHKHLHKSPELIPVIRFLNFHFPNQFIAECYAVW